MAGAIAQYKQEVTYTQCNHSVCKLACLTPLPLSSLSLPFPSLVHFPVSPLPQFSIVWGRGRRDRKETRIDETSTLHLHSHYPHVLAHDMWQHLCMCAVPCPERQSDITSCHIRDICIERLYRLPLFVVTFALSRRLCVRVGGRSQYNLSHAAVSRCQIFAFVQHFLVLSFPLPEWELEVSLVSPCQIVSRYKKHLGWHRNPRLFLNCFNMSS